MAVDTDTPLVIISLKEPEPLEKLTLHKPDKAVFAVFSSFIKKGNYYFHQIIRCLHQPCDVGLFELHNLRVLIQFKRNLTAVGGIRIDFTQVDGKKTVSA